MLQKEKSLKKNFIQYVIPSVIAQWVFALYTMVDGMFVARGVGETALAAVNISLPFVNFLFAVSIMFAVGTSTIVSIAFGQKDQKTVNEAYTQNMMTIGIVSLLFIVVILLNANPIAKMLGATENTMNYVVTYISTVAAFSPCFIFSYYFEILIKADGKPKMATVMITLGAITNCILDYVFVFVIPWGVFGAAFATGLSQLVVTIGFAFYFFGKKSRFHFTKFTFSFKRLTRTMRLGLASGITDFSAGIMVFMFNHAILTFLNEGAIVSYTIVAYVNTLLVMSLTGVAQGMQPLVSYMYGRREIGNTKKLLKYGLKAQVLITLVIGLVGVIFTPAIVGIYISSENQALREYSVQVFRTFSVSFLLVGFNVVVSGWLTAVEKPLPSMIISLGRGLVFILLGLWIATTLWGGAGIWWVPTISEGICLIASVLLLQKTLKGEKFKTL